MSKTKIVAGFAGCLLGLALVSAAWACSVQPMVLGISPMTAAPGEQVDVEGAGVATAAPLEVHWNSASGPVIGTASADADRRFAVSVAVPQAEPGIYTLVLVSQADGSLGRAAIEVIEHKAGKPSNATAGAANEVSSDLWSGVAPNSDTLSDLAKGTPGQAGSGPPPAAGVSLAGLGALGLFSGLVMVKRRAAGAARAESR